MFFCRLVVAFRVRTTLSVSSHADGRYRSLGLALAATSCDPFECWGGRRLDLLRKIVPHAERANTACFLEEVIKYIDRLKRRNEDLEKQVSKQSSSAHVRLDHMIT